MDNIKYSGNRMVRQRWLVGCCLAFAELSLWLVIRGCMPAHGPPLIPGLRHVSMPYSPDSINRRLTLNR
ncbi:MAG: hypothetical protein JSU01_00690 [Bacteroidetes bacterium]|nr:hypothetical protein [Bacteroidota bacterium]